MDCLMSMKFNIESKNNYGSFNNFYNIALKIQKKNKCSDTREYLKP